MALQSIIKSLSNQVFVKFSITGGLNTLIDFIAFMFLYNVGLSILLSNICAFHIAAICSFMLNKFWVFDHKKPFEIKLAVKFYAITTIVMFINTIFIYILDDLFESVLFAKILATGATLFINFFALKLLFR